jgi:membrane-associated phospholipid phosphatase
MRIICPDLKLLKPVDFIVVFFHALLLTLTLGFAGRIPLWPLLGGYNFCLVVFIFFAAHKTSQTKSEGEASPWKHIRIWYLLPMIVTTYKQIYVLVPAVRPGLYDEVLIAADKILFGTAPSVFLQSIASPWLTEFLQITYVSFYLLPLLLAVALLRRKRKQAFDYTTFSVMYGFFLSYLGYFIIPAVGPRFTLHDFYAINTELPGLLFTNAIREFVNVGAGTSSHNPGAANLVQRDVFPSGHTLVTLVSIYLAIRFRTRTRYVLIPVGLLLIFSTVYLRYHYAVDVLGGFAFFGITMGTGHWIFNRWQVYRGRPPFRWEGV